MMHRQLMGGFVIALVCGMLVLSGCSKSKQEQSQAQLEQAHKNLQDAKQQLTAAKKAEAAAQARHDKLAADQEAAKAKSNKQSGKQAASEAGTASSTHTKPVCGDCGTIRSITPVTANGKGTGIGAVAGGVAGGVIGSQIGHGAGKTIAEIAGTLGGAFAGNEAEKHIRKRTYYRVTVAMDAGGTRSVNVDSANRITVGTRVRVQGNNLALMH